MGTGHKGSGKGEEERPTEWVVVLVYKVFQFPSGACHSLIAPSLTLFILFVETRMPELLLATERITIDYGKDTYLNAALLSRCCLKIGLSDALCNLVPQSVSLPLALVLHWSHSGLLLGARHIRKYCTSPCVFPRGVPLALETARVVRGAPSQNQLVA